MRLTIIDKTPSDPKVVLDDLDIFGALGHVSQDLKAVADRQKSR